MHVPVVECYLLLLLLCKVIQKKARINIKLDD